MSKQTIVSGKKKTPAKPSKLVWISPVCACTYDCAQLHSTVLVVFPVATTARYTNLWYIHSYTHPTTVGTEQEANLHPQQPQTVEHLLHKCPVTRFTASLIQRHQLEDEETTDSQWSKAYKKQSK